MGRPELGTKLACTGCSERFYDLNRSPVLCPKCGAQQPAVKPRASLYPASKGPWHLRRRAPMVVVADDADSAVASEADEDEVEDDEADNDPDAEVENDTDTEPKDHAH